MKDPRPGLHPRRLATLMREAVERCRLDLSGYVVLTEAASGAYVVTPVLAAMAGAKHVYALTRSTRYGTVEEVTAETLELAGLVGVSSRLEILTQKRPEVVAQVDIVTNSGHVRPIDAEMIGVMKRSAVIPLMYEAWEYRPEDLDLDACRKRGIRVAGTNECHPDVDVFSFLGIMAVKLLTDAGIGVYGSRVVLLCDNSFGPFIERGLVNAGAVVETVTDLRLAEHVDFSDVVLVALQPRRSTVLNASDALWTAERWPGCVVAQLWGDIDRLALHGADVPVWPREAPAPGHMGILLSAVGPEPIVRLQAAGLKVAEQLLVTDPRRETAECAQVNRYAQPIPVDPL